MVINLQFVWLPALYVCSWWLCTSLFSLLTNFAHFPVLYWPNSAYYCTTIPPESCGAAGISSKVKGQHLAEFPLNTGISIPQFSTRSIHSKFTEKWKWGHHLLPQLCYKLRSSYSNTEFPLNNWRSWREKRNIKRLHTARLVIIRVSRSPENPN